jgi:hypothetical protein
VPIAEGPEGKRHTASGMALEREGGERLQNSTLVFWWMICTNAAYNLPACTQLSLGRLSRSG